MIVIFRLVQRRRVPLLVSPLAAQGHKDANGHKQQAKADSDRNDSDDNVVRCASAPT